MMRFLPVTAAVTDGGIMRRAFHNPFAPSNGGIVPPGRGNQGSVSREDVNASNGGFFGRMLHHGNGGIVPPNRGNSNPGPFSEMTPMRPLPMPLPPRHKRMMGIHARFHLREPMGIMLGDDLPAFTPVPMSPNLPDIPFIMPAVPQPVPTPATAPSGWASVFGGLLGTAVSTASAYEVNRLKMNLLSKQYSPSNVNTALQTYQGQTAVTAAQAQAEMMNRQLEYERTAGTRSGNVMSTGLVVAGLAGLLVVLMMKKPSSAKAA